MSILGKLFGNSKAISAITNGVDKLVYTEQERVENFQKALKLYEPFKIAQRLLALTFSIPYALAWIITFIMSFNIDVTEQLKLLSGTMGNIVLAIVAFYFLGGTLATTLKKKG